MQQNGLFVPWGVLLPRLSTERREKKTGTTTTKKTVAKIARDPGWILILDGRRSRVEVSDCRDDFQRRRSFPGITPPLSTVFRAVCKAGIRIVAGISLADLTESWTWPVFQSGFSLTVTFVPRREIACRRCTIKAAEWLINRGENVVACRAATIHLDSSRERTILRSKTIFNLDIGDRRKRIVFVCSERSRQGKVFF